MNTEVKTFAATLDAVEPIREFIIEKCNSVSMTKKKCYALCLAVDEIVANIVNYGYPLSGKEEGNKIDVVINSGAEEVSVTLEDEAIAFNPFDHAAPGAEYFSKPLEERPIGGLGILLAKKNVDDYRYEYVNGKNRNIFIMTGFTG